VVELLVHSGADLEVQSMDIQDTALTISSSSGHTEVVKVLLEAGANINYKNKWTETALYHQTEVTVMLLECYWRLELTSTTKIRTRTLL
jgi:hypothetical protein